MPLPAPVSLTDREWSLSFGAQRAVVHARGGALRSYEVNGHQVVDGWADHEVPPAFNGAVLAPWPNRVADGRWIADGVPQQLPINEPDRHNALHGLVMWHDWRLVEAAEDTLELACRISAQPGYPYDLELGVSWMLDAGGLGCALSAANVGHGVAPFGVATHPFFGFEGRRVDELALSLPAAQYLDVDDRLLPVARRQLEVPLGALRGVKLDTAFTAIAADSTGRRQARLTSDRGVITVWADDKFGWWQVYTSDMFDPADDRYRRSVAMEAMTCGPDAFNSGTDLIRLEPGNRWTGRWGVSALFT